jgi:peptide/nickel transport system permease protein
VAVGLSVAIGLFLGLCAGYFGGLVDEGIMRGVDVMLCFPSFFLILAVIAFLTTSLLQHLGRHRADSWMGVARLVRAETLALRGREFVLAARVSGMGAPGILFYHILPMPPRRCSCRPPGRGRAILIESSLSFLGLGVQPPMPSWGNMLMDGKEVLEVAPWLSIFPGWPSFSPCSATTSSAKACAISWTRGCGSRVRRMGR